MDAGRFDTLTRTLSTTGTRRGALSALLAGALSLLGFSEATAKKRRKPSAEGPCGNGNPKANKCKRHGQCCTGYCHRKRRCRCKRGGETCTENRNCCADKQGLTCQNGACQPGQPPSVGCAPVGQPCSASVPCCEDNTQICQGGTCRPCDVCLEDCRFSVLQPAVNAASPGATLRICPGAYTGRAVIGKPLTIIGAGLELTVLRGTLTHTGLESGGVLNTNSALGGSGGLILIQDLTIANGASFNGGGIFNAGRLTLERVLVVANVSDRPGLAAPGEGGGIYNQVPGELILTDSHVEGNRAREGTGTPPAPGLGGGIYNRSSLTLTGTSDVSANRAVGPAGSGGGVYNDGGTVTNPPGSISGNDPDQCVNVNGGTGANCVP